MLQAARLAVLAISVVAALAPTVSDGAPSPYPSGTDYGISDYLARTPVVCLKLPIDGGARPHTPDDGPRNPPERQRAIDAADQIAELGLTERTSSTLDNHREYRIKDDAAYDGRGAFCYGKEILSKIVSIAPPRPYGPFCVREAEILTAFEDVPDWAGRPSLAPYVDNRAASPLAGRRTIALRRDGGRWIAAAQYDPIHSNWVRPKSFDACAAQR